MSWEGIRDALVTFGPWMVIGVAVISLGLTAVVFATFVLNEAIFKKKAAHDGHGGHGDASHGAHH